MRLAARVILAVLLAAGGWSGASAQSLNQNFQEIGRLGQPRRAAIRAEWEKIAPGEILCVDNRLRRARRSINTLIDRGIGPTDNRVAGIVSDCRAARDPDSSNVTATPSFNCRAATQQDEVAICANPELARLDRAVVEVYERMLGSDDGRAKSVAELLLRRRHACGPDIDCIKRVQLTAIATFQARGAPVQVPGSALVTARDKGAYSVAGMQLGNNVGVGSADYRDYTCAPSEQYAGFTVCQRQQAERSRRRRVSESTSFLHAADGAAVYINQNLDPVAMDEKDAHDEISRLSQSLGKATLLPTQAARDLPSSLIASWGAVSLQPLDPARMAELAAGRYDKPGILLDTIGSPQRSAKLGLPIYRLGGGAGYVWSANWSGRGRGALRMVAIDASRLPGAAAEANLSADPASIVPAPTAPAIVTASPTSPPLEMPKPAGATQPAPSIAALSAQKSLEPAPVAAPQARTPAAAATPPTDVRVIGPPIALRPTASAAKPTPTPASSNDGNGLVIFLIALIVALLGVVGYLLKKSRVASPAAVTGVPGGFATPRPAIPPEVHAAPESEKMDLKALVPGESPVNVAAFATAMEAPRVDEAMAPAATSGESQIAKNSR